MDHPDEICANCGWRYYSHIGWAGLCEVGGVAAFRRVPYEELRAGDVVGVAGSNARWTLEAAEGVYQWRAVVGGVRVSRDVYDSAGVMVVARAAQAEPVAVIDVELELAQAVMEGANKALAAARACPGSFQVPAPPDPALHLCASCGTPRLGEEIQNDTGLCYPCYERRHIPRAQWRVPPRDFSARIREEMRMLSDDWRHKGDGLVGGLHHKRGRLL